MVLFNPFFHLIKNKENVQYFYLNGEYMAQLKLVLESIKARKDFSEINFIHVSNLKINEH